MRFVTAAFLALGLGCGEGSHAPPRIEAPPASAPAAPPAPRARPAPEPADYSPPDANGFGRAAGLRTLEVVRGGASADEPLPLVVVIHGLGDHAHARWLPGLNVPARLVMPEAPVPHGGGFAWFEFRAQGADPADLARGIVKAADQLARAIETLARERPTRGKPMVTGFSQGGMLSYALAVRRPELFALAAPVSGLLPEPLWPTEPAPAAARRLPIRALHGGADTVVPIDTARGLVTRLQALGFDAELGEHQGVGHTIDERMDVELIASVLAAIGSGR